jgi:hypothetical protein
MIEAVKDALLGNMQTQFASYLPLPKSDPLRDISFIIPPIFNKETRNPQIILSEFRLTESRWLSNGHEDINKDIEAGTVDEVRDPMYCKLQFAVTAVAATSRAADRMAEELTVYFKLYPHMLDVVLSDTVTIHLLKELVSEFIDATVPNEGGLWFQEARAAIVDVPIYDGHVEHMKLAKKIITVVTDSDTDKELVTTMVEAEG